MIDTFWLTVSSFVQAASVAIATGMHLRLAHCQKVEFRFLGVFLIYSLINEIAGQILAHLVHANGNLINNIYSILEGPILLLLYKRHVAGVRFRNVVWLLITALIAFGVIEMFWIHGPMKINTIMKVLNSVTMMFVTIFYFYVFDARNFHEGSLHASHVLGQHRLNGLFCRCFYFLHRCRLCD